ncbi:MAG: ligase-associated DNA damage response endonuclease PdeM [Rhodobacteraceae bacterium]|nr:MAG: ligase-associated DNA damage response endonuclease PdeM [Paracoccaceae bacterium]
MPLLHALPAPAAETAGVAFALAGEPLVARGSGALWAPRLGLLAVADLHLGKAARAARTGGAFLPPYETAETLARLAAEVADLAPATLVFLGDSFDDPDAAARLSETDRARLAALAAGRRALWLAGNHDPAPMGARAAAHHAGPLVFRHIAAPDATAEVSGHFHPKATVVARGRRITRRCFLIDARRVILPAFGAYAGGLDATDAAFDALLAADARAVLTGARPFAAPRAVLAPR